MVKIPGIPILNVPSGDDSPQVLISQIADGDLFNGGMCNTNQPLSIHPNYNGANKSPAKTDEKIIEGKSNQFIIMGRDRMRGPCHGYGGQGLTSCGSIDIVAGLSGRLARTRLDPQKDEGPSNTLYTNKSPELDAARIYISQRTDIDKNFSLKPGMVGQSAGKSGIAIKADAVRVVARDGIKLVTGTDVYDSQDIRINGITGIDLCAGNLDDLLQPLVLGNNLELALREIIELINDQSGIILTFLSEYLKMLNFMAVHTHISTAPGSPTSPSVDLATGCLNQFLFRAGPLVQDVLSLQTNCIAAAQNYTFPWGEGYINSPYNHTN